MYWLNQHLKEEWNLSLDSPSDVSRMKHCQDKLWKWDEVCMSVVFGYEDDHSNQTVYKCKCTHFTLQ